MPFEKLSSLQSGESSDAIRARVVAARAVQAQRYQNESNIFCNAQMNNRLITQWCQLDEESSRVLRQAMTKYDMSARAYDRILKVSRTIADLSGSEKITADHVREAIRYRNLDRASWGRQTTAGTSF